MGSWGKGKKKKWIVCGRGKPIRAAENKGRRRRGKQLRRGPYSYWNTENGKWFFTTCTWLSQSGHEAQCSCGCQRRADSETESYSDSASNRRRSPQSTYSTRTFCVMSCFLWLYTGILLGSSMLGLCCLRCLITTFTWYCVVIYISLSVCHIP